MIRDKIINFFSFFLIIFFSIFSFAGDFQPGTPSSSYNFNYHSRTKELVKDIAPKNNVQNPLAVRILVQGNSRLESTVIIRDSKIESLKTDEKT